MTYNVQSTNQAKKDIDEIFEYITIELCNQDFAKSFLNKLFRIEERLSVFPNIGTNVNNPYLKRNDIQKTFIDNFILYFVVDEDKKIVHILRIVYAKRNQENMDSVRYKHHFFKGRANRQRILGLIVGRK